MVSRYPPLFACLDNMWVLQDFTVEQLRALAGIAQPKKFSRSEAVFNQGDPALELLLINTGRVRLSKVQEDGGEITVDYRKAGDFFGENMLSEEIEYPVTAWCLEETHACGFNKQDFEQLIMDHPGIGMQVIHKLSHQIANLTSRLEDMAIVNLEERLYRLLVGVAKEHGIKSDRGIRIQFHLTHQELSFLAGSHRVSISKAMKKLERMGKIFKDGRELVLPSASG